MRRVYILVGSSRSPTEIILMARGAIIYFVTFAKSDRNNIDGARGGIIYVVTFAKSNI